jgi:hypothetical protein
MTTNGQVRERLAATRGGPAQGLVTRLLERAGEGDGVGAPTARASAAAAESTPDDQATATVASATSTAGDQAATTSSAGRGLQFGDLPVITRLGNTRTTTLWTSR